jgi:hypothetical protein
MTAPSTAESTERFRALVAIPDPAWYRPVVRLLAVLPGTGALSERLDNWRTERAIRRYRARSGA